MIHPVYRKPATPDFLDDFEANGRALPIEEREDALAEDALENDFLIVHMRS